MESPKVLLHKMVSYMVDYPKSVTIREISYNNLTILSLKVHQDDMGKIIGKKGQNFRAINTLVTKAYKKQGKEFYLKLVEN